MAESKSNRGLLLQRLLGAAVLGVTFGLSGCSHLFYNPSTKVGIDPASSTLAIEQVSFRSRDGTKLSGWYLPAHASAAASAPAARKGLIVQFHGNSDNVSTNVRSLAWMTSAGYDLFTFDYRGYGKSEGHPDQQGVNDDAVAAIRYALDRDGSQGRSRSGARDVILYGQSLGGAILLRALEDLPESERLARVRAVIVDSTFYSYRALAQSFMARSIVGWPFQELARVLVSDDYSPERVISRVSPTPLLVIHGDADTVVPVDFGKRVYDLAEQPKTLWVIPGGRHVRSMDEDSRRKRLLTYLDSIPTSSRI